MSIWQNFKETDHWAEKRIIGAILAIPVMMVVLWAIAPLFSWIRFFSVSKPVELMFDALYTHAGKFCIAGIALFIFNARRYNYSLEGYDEETARTQEVRRTSYLLWLVYALACIVYCIWMTISLKVITPAVILHLVFFLYLICSLIVLIGWKIQNTPSE